MFNWCKNKQQKRQALKRSTLIEFNSLLDNCAFGTFEFGMLEKAIQQLHDNACPKKVRKWVGDMEKLWHKNLT